MKKTVIKITVSTTALVLSALIGYGLHSLQTLETDYVIRCAFLSFVEDRPILIPKKVCEYSLYYLRDTKKDVKALTKGNGLSHILGGKENKARQYRMAEFFIKNGLDVNGTDHLGMFSTTALFSAASRNNVNDVRFLLKHGADVTIKSSSNDMTALEHAQYLQSYDEKHPEYEQQTHEKRFPENRNEIIQILKVAQPILKPSPFSSAYLKRDILSAFMKNQDVLITDATACEGQMPVGDEKTLGDYLSGAWMMHTKSGGENSLEVRYFKLKNGNIRAFVLVRSIQTNANIYSSEGVSFEMDSNKNVKRDSFACSGSG